MFSSEDVLVHADRRFALPASSERGDWLEAFKSFLKIETERLRIRHRLGMGGAELAAARSYLVDLVVCRAWQISARTVGADADGCAVIAIGGYGRGELAPASDVEAARCVEDTLKLLWDVGLTVGHSFRSVGECVAMARDDLHSRNAAADARLLCGSPLLFTRLARALERGVYRKDRETEALLEAMRVERE
jgi:[protein-PII] uridylyltransferase